MSPECYKNSRISGSGKGKPAWNLGSTLPGPCPHLPCGVFFWNRQFQPFCRRPLTTKRTHNCLLVHMNPSNAYLRSRCWLLGKINHLGGRHLPSASQVDLFTSLVIHQVTREPKLGNGRNTVSRVLFQERELTEFCGKLGEFGEKLGEFALAHK